MSIMNRNVWSVHLIHHQLRIRVTQLTLLQQTCLVEILHSLFFAFLWKTKNNNSNSHLSWPTHACVSWNLSVKTRKNCQWLLWIPFFIFNLLTWDRTAVLMRFGNPFHVTVEWHDSSFCRHHLPDSKAKRFEERCSHSMMYHSSPSTVYCLLKAASITQHKCWAQKWHHLHSRTCYTWESIMWLYFFVTWITRADFLEKRGSVGLNDEERNDYVWLLHILMMLIMTIWLSGSWSRSSAQEVTPIVDCWCTKEEIMIIFFDDNQRSSERHMCLESRMKSKKWLQQYEHWL